MKRLFMVFVLMAIIYIFGLLTFDQIKVYVNDASLIMSGIDKDKITETVRNHFNEEILDDDTVLDDDANIVVVPEYINDDKLKDLVVTVDSDATCGSGGCMTTIYLQDELNEFKSINFIYAVKEIAIEPSMTNHMRDITINGSGENIMTWDGVRYVLNAF